MEMKEERESSGATQDRTEARVNYKAAIYL